MATKKMRAETFGSVDEFRAAVNLIAKQVLAIRKEELARDKAVQNILDERNKTIEQMKAEAAGMLALCDAYAKDHREEVFPKGTKTGEEGRGHPRGGEGRPGVEVVRARQGVAGQGRGEGRRVRRRGARGARSPHRSDGASHGRTQG